MSEPLVKYWVEEIYPTDADDEIGIAGTLTVYLAADVDALLRQREEEIESLMMIQGIDLKNNNAYRQEVIDLRAQLSASQACCAQLEEALKMCVAAWEHDGEPSAIGYELAIQKAQHALTTTERTPA